MIAVIDYGMGNIGSVLNMFKAVGAEARAASSPEEITSASHIVLPGVGQFGHGVRELQSRGIWSVLEGVVKKRSTPILGICLGMQLLHEASEEGNVRGFGWVPGRVRRFVARSEGPPLKVPHMGWNEVEMVRTSLLWRELPFNPRFYFVHGYYCDPTDKAATIGQCEYGGKFCAALQVDRIFGVQFHPEKSHSFGKVLLRNFAML